MPVHVVTELEIGRPVAEVAAFAANPDAPFPMETTYTWQALGETSTRMTLRNRGEPSGFSKLLAPIMEGTMRRANRKDLERLKQLLEHAARRVVDVGCGAGVSTKAFVDAGLETLAIEPSGALLELARQNAPRARFQQASAYDAALEPCDAILAFGEALTYHEASDDAEVRVRGFFERATTTCPPSSSRTRSVRRHRLREPFVYFVDECLGRHVVPDALRQA